MSDAPPAATERPRRRKGGALRIVLFSLVFGLSLIAYSAVRFGRRMAAAPIAGVSLGMKEGEIRDAFRPGARGRFERSDDGTALEWRPFVTTPGAPHSARFDLEGDAVVRMRIEWPEGTAATDALGQLGVAFVRAPTPGTPLEHGTGELLLHDSPRVALEYSAR